MNLYIALYIYISPLSQGIEANALTHTPDRSNIQCS